MTIIIYYVPGILLKKKTVIYEIYLMTPMINANSKEYRYIFIYIRISGNLSFD